MMNSDEWERGVTNRRSGGNEISRAVLPRVVLPGAMVRDLEQYVHAHYPSGTRREFAAADAVREALRLLLEQNGLTEGRKQPGVRRHRAKALHVQIVGIRRRYPDAPTEEILDRLRVADRCQRAMEDGFTLEDLANHCGLSLDDVGPLVDDTDMLNEEAAMRLNLWSDRAEYP